MPKTTFPRREDFDGLPADYRITRADIALIADVQPLTVRGWSRDDVSFPAPIRAGSRPIVHYLIGDVIDWLCRTGRIECDLTEDTVDQAEAAKLLGVSPGSVKRWRQRGQFPAPDVVIDRSPLWKTATIKNWTGRPRRGGHQTKPRAFVPPDPPSDAQSAALTRAAP